MSGYNACCLYRALKLHFTSDYDFVKYKGKIRYSFSQFDKNKHKYFFEKLSKKYPDDELKYFFISNFIVNEKVWVVDLLNQEAFDNFTVFKKKRQSLSYVFENDAINIFHEQHKQLFKCNSDEFPLLLLKLLRDEISIETLIIIDDIFPFLYKWDLKIKENFIWPQIKMRLLKYKYFIEYDKMKFKSILVDIINETKID